MPRLPDLDANAVKEGFDLVDDDDAGGGELLLFLGGLPDDLLFLLRDGVGVRGLRSDDVDRLETRVSAWRDVVSYEEDDEAAAAA